MPIEQPAVARDDLTAGKIPATEDTPPPRPPKAVIIADLNVDPPESDGEDCAFVPIPDSSARSSNDDSAIVKSTEIIKDPEVIECEEIDQQCQGVSREEKVSILKAGLVHVARRMPKNAHAHFLLGLMYQRLGQPQKAVAAFEKSSEILQRAEEEIRRPDLLSLVLIHHAQCILQVNTSDSSDKELEPGELEDILTRLKVSLHLDAKQAAVWNTLGLILLRTGRPQSAMAVLSSILAISPDYLDSLANLGIAYLQSGNLELSAKCFQDLILKDQNHPAAMMNYATFLLCKYGSVIAGPGANAGDSAYLNKVEAATVARDCLLAAAKADPKSGPLWINLANAYYVLRDHRNAKRCLEKAAKLEPNQMSARYAIAVQRVKDAERFQECGDQISWATNEMASILKEGDPAMIDLPITWAGLAMAHSVELEIKSAYENDPKDLAEVEERALYTLKQAIEEDPNDAVQWHQFGLHNLRVLQFNTSVKFFKAAVARCKECSYAWSNLGGMADRRPRRSRREDAAQHRAEHTDTARSLEPVSHLDLLREWPVTCDRFIGALDAAGVGSLRHLSYITLDSRLLTALVERWSPTTNTFLLPVGEMTITLEDVAVILGVRTDGPALIGPIAVGPGCRWASWPECCDDLLGQHPLENVVYANPRNPNEHSTFKIGQAGAQTCLPLRWLRWQFAREMYEDLSHLELSRCVRGYILYLIGCFLMPDTSGSEVHLQWLPLLEDTRRFEQYSLGGAVLAHLYRELAESVRPSKARIAGCLHLMQVWAWEHFHVGRSILYVPSWEAVEGKPLRYRWNEGWMRNHPMNTVVHYRNDLDTLQQSQVIWNPYTDDIMTTLPAICRDGNEIRLARVPLISWVKVEWYLPDRVMRQFDYQQHIDLEGIPKEFKRVDARGKGGMDWSWYHRRECALWDRRREFIQEPVLVDFNPHTALAIYMTWYRNWARCYLVQPPPQPPQTYYPRAPYEREFYDYFRETAATLSPLDDAEASPHWVEARRHLMSLADDIADRLHLEDYIADPSTTGYAPYVHTSGADAGAGPSHSEYPPVMSSYDQTAVGPIQTQESQITIWDAWPQTTTTIASGVEEEEEGDLEHRRPRNAPDRYTPGSHAVYRRRRRPQT